MPLYFSWSFKGFDSLLVSSKSAWDLRVRGVFRWQLSSSTALPVNLVTSPCQQEDTIFMQEHESGCVEKHFFLSDQINIWKVRQNWNLLFQSLWSLELYYITSCSFERRCFSQETSQKLVKTFVRTILSKIEHTQRKSVHFSSHRLPEWVVFRDHEKRHLYLTLKTSQETTWFGWRRLKWEEVQATLQDQEINFEYL